MKKHIGYKFKKAKEDKIRESCPHMKKSVNCADEQTAYQVLSENNIINMTKQAISNTCIY